MSNTAKGKTTNATNPKPTCSICGKKAAKDPCWSIPGPYCKDHEIKYGGEWMYCAKGDCSGICEHNDGVTFCSLHGGQDYIPRTREEVEKPAKTPRLKVKLRMPEHIYAVEVECDYNTTPLSQIKALAIQALGECKPVVFLHEVVPLDKVEE